MRIIAPLLMLAVVAGCAPAPTNATKSNPTPKPKASSSAPTTTPTALPSTPSGNGMPEVRFTYTGASGTFDGQAIKLNSDKADRVFTADSALITVGSLIGVLTLPEGEHQIAIAIAGEGRSPYVDGFTGDEIKSFTWNIWVGDGKFIPNKYAPAGDAEIKEHSVANGLLNLRYKGTVKQMINGDERTLDLTVKDFPLR